jgi:hypothetical protein
MKLLDIRELARNTMRIRQGRKSLSAKLFYRAPL